MMCESLTSLKADGLVSIGREALFETPIRSLICPDLLRIDAAACLGCVRLEKLRLPSLETLGRYVFYRCCRLQRVIIPESVTHIPASAFAWCVSLTEVDVRSRYVLGVEDQAFAGCSNGLTIRGTGCKAIEEYCQQSGIRLL